MQIPYRICPEISSTNHLRKDKAGHRTDDPKDVRVQGSRDNRSRSVQRSYPYARINPAKVQCVAIYGVLKGNEQLNDIRKKANLEEQGKYPDLHIPA